MFHFFHFFFTALSLGISMRCAAIERWRGRRHYLRRLSFSIFVIFSLLFLFGRLYFPLLFCFLFLFRTPSDGHIRRVNRRPTHAHLPFSFFFLKFVFDYFAPKIRSMVIEWGAEKESILCCCCFFLHFRVRQHRDDAVASRWRRPFEPWNKKEEQWECSGIGESLQQQTAGCW